MSDPISGRDERGILARTDGASIAYRRVLCHQGNSLSPTVIFLHGLMSDMEGGKAIQLAAHAVLSGFSFVRFDMFGHGKSSGDFTDGCIGRWRDDTLAVIDELTSGPVILVGSSMGGWVMLLAALARPERVKALIGIAPAPDFTEDTLRPAMTPADIETFNREGCVHLHDNDGTYPVSRLLMEDGAQNLLLRHPIPFTGPVRILQGMQDTSVPWRTALTLADRLESTNTTITLVKDGDHRLSRTQDLLLLTRTLDALMEDLF
ncbi:MAG: alpha/beta hydrolase [Rhodospirillaceae bacterium]|nr:alpha/beta hydrolase [Rhodospirillaceae bacterium]